MEPVSTTDFLKAINGQTAHIDHLPAHIQRITLDSRTLIPGDVFWAIPGENHDGHQFVNSALEKGASACLVRNDFELETISNSHRLIRVKDTLEAWSLFAKWYRSRYSTTAIGVTGSFGKTTTRELLDSVLSVKQNGIQSEHNYNNEIGVPLTLLRLHSEHRFLIVEMGAAKAGDIQPLTEITSPQIGIITGIGPAHLSGFRTIEQIIQTKGELIAGLPQDGLAVIPGDKEYTQQLTRMAPCRVLTFGQSADCSYYATNIELINGQLTLAVNGNKYRISINGRHYWTTAASVIAVATELGYSPQEIQTGFENFQPIEGRGNLRQTLPWTVIDDTYNANPASCEAACELLSDWNTQGPRILILGDMLELGPGSASYHRTLGRFAGTQPNIDVILAFGEYAGQVAAGVKEIQNQQILVKAFTQRNELIDSLLGLIGPDDVVLVKGSRGMRMEQIVEELLVEETNLETKSAA